MDRNAFPRSQNVVERLKARLSDARSLGWTVRLEVLQDEQPSWCVIAGVPTMFVDVSQTAADQLRQIDQTLQAFENHCGGRAA
jgi:hypothetical protein